MSVIKSTSSSGFTGNQECLSGDAVKGLMYASGTLTFRCGSAGSNNSSNPGAKGDTGLTGAAGIQGPAGATPTISVDTSIRVGAAAVSVLKSSNDYKFTFALPSTPSGYIEKYTCFKNTGEIHILSSSSSNCSAGTKYKILLADSP